MARGDYYLGVKNENNGFSKIDLSTINVEGKEVSKKLQSIVNFTTRYASEEDLINDLIRFQLVPKNTSSSSLAYVAEHGNKKAGYTYRPIRYGTNIYLNKYENCFNPNKLQSFVVNNMQDVKFAKNLYMEICVKRGVLTDFNNHVRELFEAVMKNNELISKEAYISVCNNIINHYNNSDSFVKLMKSFIRDANNNKYPTNNKELEAIINQIYHHVKKDGYVLFQHVTNKGNYYMKNSHISYASAGYNMAKKLRDIRKNNTNSDQEIISDIRENAEKLYESLVKKRSSDEFEISDRSFIDLAFFVAHYEHFLQENNLETTIAKKKSEKLDTDEIVKQESIIPSEEDIDEYNDLLDSIIPYSGEEPVEKGPIKVLTDK